jgi:LacI family transcriptional regulator, gluconate utilization system Gnt-I transcriptional repressor
MADRHPREASVASRARARRKGHGRATLADVAQRAGVSPITVSRALRSPLLVAAATRERIARAVEEMGYLPNLLAGSLASSSPRTAAAVLPTLDASIFTDVLKGVVDVLDRDAYQLVLGNSHWSLAVEETLVATFLSHRVGAIILTGATHSRRTRVLLAASGIPVVETWSLPDEPLGACVGFSNEAAAAAMTRHLVARGYRDVAFVSAPVDDNDRTADRRRGFLSSLRAHGREAGLDRTFESPFSLAAGGAVLERIRERRPATDAVFFANDVLAAGALLAAQRAGLRVPQDVAIAGFDDTELAGALTPPLTTVRIDREGLGRRAGELMLAGIRGEPIAGTKLDIGFEIVVRGST